MKWSIIITLYRLIEVSNAIDHEHRQNLEVIYEWAQIEFAYPSEEARQNDIDSGNFAEGFVQPFDVQIYHKEKQREVIFVTTARYRDGIPATLSIVTDERRKGNHILKPYPSWEWHTDPRKCKKHRIVSVYRAFLDNCDRMWIIDTGNIEPEIVCPPQILLFDLKTDKLIHSYEIPEEQHQNRSLYVTAKVEVEDPLDGGKNSFLYGADSDGYSLIVYDYKNDRSWRVDHESFLPQKDYILYEIAEREFNVSDGILGMALGVPGENRKLFYHAMSSETESWVYTKHLKDERLFAAPASNISHLFHTFPQGRKTQSAAEAIDKNGIMYFGLLKDVQIVAWDTASKNYGREYFRVVQEDTERLQFPSGVKVTKNNHGDEFLWVFATAYQKVASTNLYTNETNFRILCGKISDFVYNFCAGTMRLTTFLLAICASCVAVHQRPALKNLKLLYEWSQLEFDYQSDAAREADIKSGNFVKGQVQPFDVQGYFGAGKNVIFVTSARYREGIPATLGTVTNKTRKGNPIIKPYPSWEWQTEPRLCKKNRIVSVYRIFIDECDRLWVIDNGKIGEEQACPPLILAFDMKTDKLLHSYEIPAQQHQNVSLYVTPIVEVESITNSCQKTFVYLADSDAGSLVVYDYENNKSWSIRHETFRPDPVFNKYRVAGTTFEVADAILGMTISPPGMDRLLYYHPMSSEKEHWVYTKYLKNESLFLKPSPETMKLFQTFPNGRGTQAVAEAMDSKGVMYFGLLEDVQVVSWNSKTKNYSRENFRVVDDDPKTLQYPSGVKVTLDENSHEWLWLLTTAYQKLASGQLNSNETNFRILTGKIAEFKYK
ncbi:uncharacterized protein LOC132700081 [Cylas formicarius]|uniref:uncharacterized protein LOC132700081 n=1 Tax=Cylas formicarius TaxID=197179 RepID=UPI0029588581|nr:uncharacterized protein LOC132700081 [Cylas formicarius]